MRTGAAHAAEEHIEDPGAGSSAAASTEHTAAGVIGTGIVASPASSPETMKNVPLGPH